MVKIKSMDDLEHESEEAKMRVFRWVRSFVRDKTGNNMTIEDELRLLDCIDQVSYSSKLHAQRKAICNMNEN